MKLTYSESGAECPYCYNSNKAIITSIIICEKCEKEFKVEVIIKLQYIGIEIRDERKLG